MLLDVVVSNKLFEPPSDRQREEASRQLLETRSTTGNVLEVRMGSIVDKSLPMGIKKCDTSPQPAVFREGRRVPYVGMQLVQLLYSPGKLVIQRRGECL